MAIGFSYTLKPDEAESLKELKSFMGKATELSKFALKIDQTKALEEFESFIQKLQNSEVEVKIKYGEGTGSSGTKVGDAIGNNIVEGVEQAGNGIRQATDRQVQLVQDRLNNALNNLTLKADSKGLQGLLPVEQIIQQINQLGQSGESLRQINLQAAEIRTELQMWGQALNNDSRELAEVTNLAGQLASKVGDQKEIAKNNQELQKLIKSRQEDINAQIKQIQTSREFKTMTAQQQTAFNDLANSMKIVAYSAEGANQQFSEFRDELVTQQRLMQDREIDRISDAYERLGGTIQNLVLRYASLQLVLHQMKQYFQEAIEYTYELDAAYTDVAISMDISREEFGKWTEDAMEIARANGIATTSVLDMVKIYATAGEDISAVAEKLSGTAMLQNITQWDADQTTSVINSIINQYQLLDKEINGVTGSVSNAINYLGDNLIAISNALEIDNVKGIQEMASAIDDAGSVVKNAGGSMEWFMSVTGALAERMNATGSEVGAALRMITARTLQQKQAIEELDGSIEDADLVIANAEKALNQIGVTIRGGGGDLRDIEDILGDVASKWDTLSDSTRGYVAAMLAGTNRRSYFETLMNNYERVIELQEAADDSAGQLAEANQKRVESLEGIRGQLEVTKEALYGTILTDEGMKSILKGTDTFLQGVTSLIQFIKDNAIPTLTALGTTLALIELKMYAQGKGGVAFLQGKISDFILSLGSAIESMGGAGKTVNILSKSFELSAFQVGLAKVAMGGLAVVAATLAVKVGVELYKAFKNATPSVEELQSKLNDLKSSMQEYNQAQEKFESVKVDVSSMKEMVNTINDENASWKEQQELTQEVNDKLAQHASSYTSIEGLLKNENIALETRIALLEKQAEIEANSAQLETLGQLRQKDGIFGLSGTVIDQLGNSVDKALEELNSASVLATHYTDEIARLGDQANKELIGTAESYQKQLAESKSTVEQMAQLYLEYFSLVSSVKDKADPIEYKGWMDQLNAVKQALEQASEDYGVELKLYLDTASIMEQSEEVNGAVESVANKISELSASMNEGVDASGLATSISSLIGEISELGEDSDEAKTVLKELHSVFTDMPDDVDTLAEAIDYLNGKLDETSNSANMKGFNESYLEALEGIEDARELLDSFKDGLTTNEMRSLFDSDLLADYNGALTDSVSIQEHLNNKIAEMQGIAADAYFEMNKNSEEFWNNQIKNSQSWIDYEKQTQDELTQHLADSFGIRLQDFEVYINEKGGLRDVDLSNAKNLSEAERIVNSDLNSQLLTLFAGFVNEKADARIDDMDNVVAFLKAQEGEEIKTIQQLAQLWNEYYNAKKAEINATISTLKKVDVTATQVKTDALNQMNDILGKKGLTNPNNHYQSLYGQATQLSQDVQKATQELEQLETENNKFQSVLNKLNNYGGSATNTLKQDYVGANSNSFGGSSGSGSGSSSGKGSSGSSSSEKEVADLELAIDRYYELNDALEDVNNALEKNSIQRDNADTIEQYNKLVEEEIKLTNQKIQALENLRKEQEKEASELKSALSSQGITFDSSGNVTNYSQRLQQLQDQANKLSGTAKETAIANVNAVKDMIDQYTTLTNSTIPGTTNQILEMKKEVENIRKEQEEMVKQVERLGERYYTVLQTITKVDNRLELISAKQENAHGQERVELLNQEIELLKEKQKLIQQQQKEMTVEATELYEELKSLNVEFDDDGYIKNYDSLIKKLEDQANKLVGDARDSKVEEAEKLIELIEKYDVLVKDSLPSLGVEWIELNNEILALEKSKLETVADVEKQITNAITSELQKRTDATKKEIEKQKQLYLDAYDEEDYQTELVKEQRKLDEIQQQINNLARDTSLAGQLKLQDLMQQYQEQQDIINNLIRDHEKQQGSDRFDEEMDKLDEKLENALEPENMAQIVADALTTGLVTVGDEIIQLDQLMADFAVESEGAITALSNTIRAEMVESLREAQGLINDLGMSYRALIGYNETLSQARASQNVNSATSRSIAPSVEFNAPILTVEGDITQDIDSRLSDLATQVQNTVMKTVTKALSTV